MANKGILQRMPDNLKAQVEAWAARNECDRTEAINHMCRTFLEQEEVTRLRAEKQDLINKLIKLSMDTRQPLPNMQDYMY